jgi:hypothetical protein
VIHVYASSLAKYQASNWAKFGTLVGDLEDCIDGIESVDELKVKNEVSDEEVYDLSGRKISPQLKNKGVYIVNGRKVLF